MSTHTLIREGRLRLGMTPEQFGNAVGVSRGAVQQWEKPGGTAPNRKKQPAVAKLLGISVSELMANDAGLDCKITASKIPETAQENTFPHKFRPTLHALLEHLSAYLASMDIESRHLAGSLLRELALNTASHEKIALTIEALNNSGNRKQA